MRVRSVLLLLAGIGFSGFLLLTLLNFLDNEGVATFRSGTEVSSIQHQPQRRTSGTTSSADSLSASNLSADSGSKSRGEPGRIPVRVQDQTGQALAEVFVELVRSRSKADLRSPVDYGFTDDDGRITLQGMTGTALVIVNRGRASSPGHGELDERLDLSNPPEDPLELVLDRCAARLIVRAVTRSGVPVSGGVFVARDVERGARFSMRTGKSGEAVFDHMPAGTYEVSATFEHSKPKVKIPAVETVQLHQDKITPLNLILTPRSAVRVHLRFLGDLPPGSLTVKTQFFHTNAEWSEQMVQCTLEDETETTTQILAGVSKVRASAAINGLPLLAVPKQQRLDVPEDSRVDCEIFVHAAGHELVCRVVNENGEPVARQKVIGSVLHPFRTGETISLSAISDDTGRAVFPALPDGTIRLQPGTVRRDLQCARYGLPAGNELVVPTSAAQVDLRLPRGYAVTVRLPAPATGGEMVELESHPLSGLPLAVGTTEFRFRELYRRAYKVTLKSPRGEVLASGTVDLNALQGDQTTLVWQFQN